MRNENIKGEKILVYPKYVMDILDNYNEIISPRKVGKDEYLKIHHKYISNEFESPFRVEDSFISHDNITNYTVKFLGINRYATISMPIYNTLYEILLVKDNLLETNIINENKYYPGFRIKRWFYDRIQEDIYSDFISYIEYNGNNCINDNKLYKIEVEYRDNKILYFRFISAMSK